MTATFRFSLTNAWLLAAVLMPLTAGSQQLTLEHVLELPDGSEIIAYDPHQDVLLVTGSATIRTFAWDGGAAKPEAQHTIELAETFAPRDTLRDISSVAVDPLGRGFGAATLIPGDNGQRRGRVVFFELATGDRLATIEAGYHPDSLTFSADGKTVVVVNEGEFTPPEVGGGGDRDAPGSLSLINITQEDDGSTPRFVYAGDFPLVWHALEPGVTLDALRINDPTTTQPYRHAEPEYAVVLDHRVAVAFQENNALGVFDLRRKRWSALASLGIRPMTVDASDQDGPTIDDDVFGLPTPDTLIAFRDPRPTESREPLGMILATADEGDFRVDDGDRQRVADFINASDAQFADVQRLRVSIPDSDPNNDGRLDRVVATGTRGVSLWAVPTRGCAFAKRIGHTGSLETYLLEQDPDRHNLNSKSAVPEDDPAEQTVDARSDDKGPEPEGLAAFPPFDHDDNPATPARTYLLVALERQNGLVLIDATDPAQPTPAAYRNDLPQLAAPECVIVIPRQHTPDQATRFIVAYEGNDAGQRLGLGVYRLDTTPSP
ncbi:MAG: hypothetical protein AAGJ38_02270 [Planctomycetota bacterium]